MKIKFLGKCPKIVELPVPFLSKSDKEGEVICNPVGDFPDEYGRKLLELSGANGLFQLVEDVRSAPTPAVTAEAEGKEEEPEPETVDIAGRRFKRIPKRRGRPRSPATREKLRAIAKRRWEREKAVPATQEANEPSPAMEG